MACDGHLGRSYTPTPVTYVDTNGDGIPDAPGSGTDGGITPGDGSTPEIPTNLPCDTGFAFTPTQPQTSGLIDVSYESSAAAYVYISFAFSGPGTIAQTVDDVLHDSPPYKWGTTFVASQGGTYTVKFLANNGATEIASCQMYILYTGAPPELPDVGDPGDPGDPDDSQCALNQLAPTDPNRCLSPPSVFTPSGPGEWTCLDNANYVRNSDPPTCKIWCPAEYCDMTIHPEGCPQGGLEAVFIPADSIGYEQLCADVCRSKPHWDIGFACWDDQYSVCRHPYDCGTPIHYPP